MNLLGQSSKSQKFSKKSLELRAQLWPDLQADQIWDRLSYDGWITVPRVLPLMLTLIDLRHKASGIGTGNPSRAYLDLWLRMNNEAYVEVSDESECAFASGYTGRRGLRTWRDHIQKLADMDFVLIKPIGLRKIGYVFLINPYLVAEKALKAKQVPEEWKTAFLARVHKTGAHLPSNAAKSKSNRLKRATKQSTAVDDFSEKSKKP